MLSRFELSDGISIHFQGGDRLLIGNLGEEL
jgi:hypothetical protein